MAKSRYTRARSQVNALPPRLRSCLTIIVGLFAFLVVLFLVEGLRNKVIDFIAIILNTLVLSNLFLFNIIIIFILLGLIFLVLYLYSKL